MLVREATKQLICTSTGSPPSFGRTRESYVFGSCRKDRMTASVTTVASLSFIRIALFLVPELVGRMSVSWLYASFFSHQRLINGFVLGIVCAFAYFLAPLSPTVLSVSPFTRLFLHCSPSMLCWLSLWSWNLIFHFLAFTKSYGNALRKKKFHRLPSSVVNGETYPWQDLSRKQLAKSVSMIDALGAIFPKARFFFVAVGCS